MRVTVAIPVEVYERLVAIASTHAMTAQEWIPRHLAQWAAGYHVARGQLVAGGVLEPGDVGGAGGADSDHRD